MPRYFFHVQDGRDFPDTLGTELPNEKAARDEAMEAGAQIVAGLGDKLWKVSDWQMRVVDEADHVILTLSFRGQMQEFSAG